MAARVEDAWKRAVGVSEGPAPQTRPAVATQAKAPAAASAPSSAAPSPSPKLEATLEEPSKLSIDTSIAAAAAVAAAAAAAADVDLQRSKGLESPPPSHNAGLVTQSDFALGRSGDSTRDRVQQALFEALGDEPVDGACVSRNELAVRAENGILMATRRPSGPAVNEAYRSKFRNLSHSLRDPSNKQLRVALFRGEVTPEQLASMSLDDLANPQLKERRAAELQEMLERARSDLKKKAQQGVNLFKCPRCRKSNATYYQMQTRSADEPMTVFITCIECGCQWKQN
jgi:transcription elongation factor S-II